MEHAAFYWAHLPFWLGTYALSLLAWTCLGRFVLSFILPPDSGNYIWRFFVLVTAWPVRAAAWLTPRVVPFILLPLLATLWLFLARFAFFTVMFAAGLAPTLGSLPVGPPAPPAATAPAAPGGTR